MNRNRGRLVVIAPVALGLLAVGYLTYITVELKRLSYRYGRVAAELGSERAQNERLGKLVEPAQFAQQAKSIIEDQEAYIKAVDKDRNDIARDRAVKEEQFKERERQIAELTDKLRAAEKERGPSKDALDRGARALLEALLTGDETRSRFLASLKRRDDRLERVRQARQRVGKDDAKAPLDIRGEIAALDQRLGLVILNVGPRQGAQKGMPFVIHRKGEYVGCAVVWDLLTPDLCGALCDRDSTRTVEAGDDVAFTVPADF